MKAVRGRSRLLAAAMMVLLLAACGAEGGAAEDGEAATGSTAEEAAPAAEESGTEAESAGTGAATSGEVTPVRIASILSGQAGYLTALIQHLELGAKHGLDLEVNDLGFVESANALRQERADVAMMAPSTIVRLLAEQEFESVVIGPTNWSGNAWVVRADAPFESFADLQGERIGNFPRTTGAYFFSSVLANAMDLNIEEDFESVEADVSALVALLENGELAAVNLFQPHIARLVVTGDYRVLTDFDDAFLDVMGARPLKAGYAATPEWIEANPDAVAAFQQVLAEAIRTIKAGEDEEFFRENAAELFGLTTPEQVDAGFEVNRLNYVAPDEWSQENVEVQSKILQEGIDLGLLPEASQGWQDLVWLDCYYDCPSS